MKVDMSASLRVAQAKFNVSAVQLSKEFGLHPQQITRYRNSEDMKVSTAVRLASYFNLTLAEFVELGANNG